MSTSSRSLAARLARDEKGNVAILFGLMSIPLFGIMGIAIDYSRAIRMQSILQTTVDTAALSALSVYRQTGDEEKASLRLAAFVEERLSHKGLTLAGDGAQAGLGQVTLTNNTVNPTDSTAHPTLTSAIDTTLLALFGVDQLEVSASSLSAVSGSSVSGTKALELSVVLDVSGSMGDNNKINDMKEAAQDFLDIVMPDDLAVENRKVGIVPFTTYVNAGQFAAPALGLDPTNQVQDGTTSVVTFSTTDFSWKNKTQCGNRVQQTTEFSNLSQDDAEAYCLANFTKHATQNKWWTPDKVTNQVPNMVEKKLVTCVTERQGDEAYTDAAPGDDQYVGLRNPSNSVSSHYTSTGACTDSGSDVPVIKPLTTDKASLKDHIATFTDLGWTAGHVATAWAWYMLAPAWQSVFGVDVAPYNDGETIKAVVIMTDGEFNQSKTNTSASDQARALCTEMKEEKGITIYTIGFDMAQNADGTPNLSNAAVDLLVDCASPGKYFFPYDGDTLREAFTEIGNSLVTIVTISSDDTGVIIKE